MALDFFVNFERTSNSSIFYREASTKPFEAVLLLADLDNTSVKLSDNYEAWYYINNVDEQQPFNTFKQTVLIDIKEEQNIEF